MIELQDVRELSIEGCKDDYATLWAAFKELLGLSDSETAKAVSLCVSICPHCYESTGYCTCMMDD